MQDPRHPQLKNRAEVNGSNHHSHIPQPQSKPDGHVVKQKLLGQAGMASEPLTAATSDLGETALESLDLCSNHAVGVVCAHI